MNLPISTPGFSQGRRRRGAVMVPVVAGVLILVVIGAAVLFLRARNANAGTEQEHAAAPQWVVATRQTIPVKVIATGSLLARDQVDIINIIEHRDDPVIEKVIEEGTWVKKGDWLVTLSAPSIISERDEMESQVLEAVAQVEEANRNQAIERDTLASTEAKAKLAVELAELEYQEWLSGTIPQRELELQLALEKAERELDQAQRELELSKELYEQKFISRTELEADEITLIEAQNAIQKAKLSITVFNKYEKVMQEKEMVSNVEQAQAELQRTQRKNENQIELLNARIANEASDLEQRKLRLDRLQRMTDAITVYAPADGLVIYGSTIGGGWDRRAPIRQGARVWGGRRIMVITDTTHLLANVNVHESRIRDIKVGQDVIVEMVARPGLRLEGKVMSKKNSANTDNSSNPNLAEYTVVIQLPPNDEGEDLKPGMSCSAEIFIRNIDDALALPIQAVHTEGQTHFVYVPSERGKVRKQVIEVGGASDTMVQVTSGLDEGAQVLLRNPKPGEIDRPLAETPQTAALAR